MASNRNPAPGPDQRNKYPIAVGPKYEKFREQKGWIYDPYSDSYKPDPKVAKPYYEDTGLIDKEKKPPGLADAIMPVLGTSAAIGVGQSLGKDGGAGLLSGLKETVSGASDLFGTAADKVSSGVNFVKDTFGFGGGTDAGMQATQQAMSTGGEALASGGSQLAQTEAANQAWNAGADQATSAVAPGMLQQGLGAAGAAYGAYNALQGVKEGDPLQAGLGGAGAVAGLNAMGYALGPWGVAATIVAPAALAYLNDQFFSSKSTKEYQKERTDQLLEKGFTEEQLRVLRPTTFDDMPKADDGEWKRLMKIPGNKERFENSVTANWGSDGMLKAFGPEYLNEMSEQDRWALTRAAIDNKFLKSDKGDRVMAGPNKEKLRAMADEAKNNPAYIAEYQKWVEAGKPPNGLDPLITDESQATPGTDPTQAGLLAGGPAQPQAAAPVPVTQGSAPAAANAGLLAGGVRPLGFDPDPNNPGKFIRRK